MYRYIYVNVTFITYNSCLGLISTLLFWGPSDKINKNDYLQRDYPKIQHWLNQ